MIYACILCLSIGYAIGNWAKARNLKRLHRAGWCAGLRRGMEIERESRRDDFAGRN